MTKNIYLHPGWYFFTNNSFTQSISWPLKGLAILRTQDPGENPFNWEGKVDEILRWPANSQIFAIFTPIFSGNGIQFDGCIFFHMKPPTRIDTQKIQLFLRSEAPILDITSQKLTALKQPSSGKNTFLGCNVVVTLLVLGCLFWWGIDLLILFYHWWFLCKISSRPSPAGWELPLQNARKIQV